MSSHSMNVVLLLPTALLPKLELAWASGMLMSLQTFLRLQMAATEYLTQRDLNLPTALVMPKLEGVLTFLRSKMRVLYLTSRDLNLSDLPEVVDGGHGLV